MEFFLKLYDRSPYYLPSVEILAFLGLYFFLSLPRSKRRQTFYLLPFTIVSLIFVYEHLGAATNIFKELNGLVYDNLYPNHSRDLYNLWVFNIFSNQIGCVLYLLLLRYHIKSPKKKKIISIMIGFAVCIALVLEVSGMLPIVDSQPILFFLFFGSNIIASGIYFIDLLTSPAYLDINPLEQFSFWQATFILFYFSMIFLIQVAFNYLWANYPDLLVSLYHFPRILSILSSVTLVATLASYKLKWKSDKQLIYV